MYSKEKLRRCNCATFEENLGDQVLVVMEECECKTEYDKKTFFFHSYLLKYFFQVCVCVCVVSVYVCGVCVCLCVFMIVRSFYVFYYFSIQVVGRGL